MNAKTGKIGIIAGTGKYPLYLFREVRRRGCEVAVLALSDGVDGRLSREADGFFRISAGQFNRTVGVCRKEGIERVMMAGRLAHGNLYRNIKLDRRAIGFMMKLKDRRANSILRGIADEFGKDGITLVDSIEYMRDFLAKPGVLTREKPTRKEKGDIDLGYRIAKGIAGLDVGQTVIVKDGAVLAVEAMEGTDAAIARGGKLGGEGTVMVKVSKPDQDVRFDIPVLGTRTVGQAKKAGIRVIAFSAGMTLLLEKDDMVRACDKNGMVLYSIRERAGKPRR